MRQLLYPCLIALFLANLAAGQIDLSEIDLPGVEPTENAASPGAVKLAQVAWNQTAAAPGDRIALAVVLDIPEPLHINSATPPGQKLIPTKISASAQKAVLFFGQPQYPPTKTITADYGDGPRELPVYAGRTVMYLPVTLAPMVKPGEYEVKVKVSWQACDDRTCFPPEEAEQTVMLKVAADGAANESINAELFADYRADAPAAQLLKFNFFGWDFDIDPTDAMVLMLLAAVGGFLLNLTPCVLPMIPLKIMAISATSAHRGKSLFYGLVMSLGVVAFWLAMGLAISLISGFSAISELFSEAWFTFSVGAIILVMALGMFGLFSTSLPQWVYRINPRHDTVHGSFGFGVMTAVLSTPCTAPFMGAAASWAVTQSPAITISTFIAIGVGMALPYAFLSAFPKLVDHMPRTGPASEVVKQVMGWLIAAAGAYFLGIAISAWLNTPPDPVSRLYWWVVALFVAVAGLWLIVRTWQLAKRAVTKVIFTAMGVVLIGIAVFGGMRLTASSPIDWIYYTPQRLADAQSDDKAVVLEFTAEWCLNCHTLEQAVLHNPQVVALMNDPDVAPIKVDITKDPLAKAKLKEVGRVTIPYLIVYDRQGNRLFDSDAYTVEQLVDILNKAKEGTPP